MHPWHRGFELDDWIALFCVLRMPVSVVSKACSASIFHIGCIVDPLLLFQVEVEFSDGSNFNLPAEFLRVYSPAVDSKIRTIGGEKVMFPYLRLFVEIYVIVRRDMAWQTIVCCASSCWLVIKSWLLMIPKCCDLCICLIHLFGLFSGDLNFLLFIFVLIWLHSHYRCCTCLLGLWLSNF